jgi:hypothetical protein
VGGEDRERAKDLWQKRFGFDENEIIIVKAKNWKKSKKRKKRTI